MPYNKTPFKMSGKSPMMKALVGKQKNLPEALKAKILASPAKQQSAGSKSIYSPAKQKSDEEDKIKAQYDGDGSGPKRSPAKQMSKLKKKSPVKQDVKVKDIPDKVVEGVKKIGKKIGNIKISTEEGRKRRKERRDLRNKQKEEKKKSPAKKYHKSPAKKKGCKYGKSPVKQAKSKKEMKYDKTAQKAENAAVSGKVRKNSRLVNKANKMNKKNNLNKGKIAKM